MLDFEYRNISKLDKNKCENININSQKIKTYITKNFFKNINSLYENYLKQSNDVLTNILIIHQENLLSIAEIYSDEMNSFTPFTTNEEIWDKFMDKPLKNEFVNINQDFIYEIDNLKIDFLVKLYNHFVDYSIKNNFSFIKINDPDYNTLVKDTYNFPTHVKVNKDDADAIRSTLVDGVLLTTEIADEILGTNFSLAADAVDIGSSVSGIKIRGSKNYKKAIKYIETIINHFTSVKRKEILNDTDTQKKYLMEYFKNMIILED